MIRLLMAALLLFATACVTNTTPGANSTPTATALAADATRAAATAQAAPVATATHDTEQFPPLAQLEQTGTPGFAASAAGNAPTSQIDSGALTAAAIVAQATAQAQGAAQPSAAQADCAPSAFSASLDTLAAQARAALESAGLAPSAVTMASAGIAGAGAGCADLLPLYTTLAITLPADSLDDAAALAAAVEQALAALAAIPPASLPGAHPPLLALTFSAGAEPPLAFVVPYQAAHEAYAAGLRGAGLLALLAPIAP